MDYKENVIFYFSGTGNTLYTANAIAKELGNCDIVPITEYDGYAVRAKTIGIFFPTYFWGMPLIVNEFLEGLRIAGPTYLYGVSTYGMSTGGSLILAYRRLKKRGIKMTAAFAVKMPDNYIVIIDAPNPKTIEAIYEKADESIVKIAEKIKLRRTHLVPIRRRNPVSTAVYHPFKRNVRQKDTQFIVNDSCIKCGKCIDYCPVDNIKIGEEGNVEFNHRCEFCMACIQRCPQNAISFQGKTDGHIRYVHPILSEEEG